MSRLTCKYDVDNVLRDMCTFDRESNVEADDCLTCFEYCNNKDMNCEKCAIQKAFDKLAEYEDLEEKGLLKKFDCAIGDTVYRIDRHYEICECIVTGIIQQFNTTFYLLHINFDNDNYNTVSQIWFDRCQIGYEFYLTKEEAEAKLKELESE